MDVLPGVVAPRAKAFGFQPATHRARRDARKSSVLGHAAGLYRGSDQTDEKKRVVEITRKMVQGNAGTSAWCCFRLLMEEQRAQYRLYRALERTIRQRLAQLDAQVSDECGQGA